MEGVFESFSIVMKMEKILNGRQGRPKGME